MTDIRISGTDSNIGNMMECILGIAYTFKTNGVHLPEEADLAYCTEKQPARWCKVWDVLQGQFGLGPTIDPALLRKAGLAVLSERGHRNMGPMSDQEVTDKVI